MLSGRYPHATRTEDLHTPLPDGRAPAAVPPPGRRVLHRPHGQDPLRAQRRAAVPVVRAGDRGGPSRAFSTAAGTRPFFLWVGFHEPHRPYPAGPPGHPPARVALTPYLADTPRDPRRRRPLLRRDRPHGRARSARCSASSSDAGSWSDTLVVFLSDNGAPFPREKGTLYDGGTRTPLILSWPGVIRAGTVYDERSREHGGPRAHAARARRGPAPADDAGPKLSLARSPSPLRAPGREYVFSERNWHDCDEHQRAVRTTRFKLIRTDAYTALPLCAAADIGASPSFLDLRARAGRTPHPRAAPALRGPARAARAVRPGPRSLGAPQRGRRSGLRGGGARLAGVLEDWIERTDDFPAAYRVRDDNTDRITGVPFTKKIPPLRNPDPPPPAERWGRAGPS